MRKICVWALLGTFCLASGCELMDSVNQGVHQGTHLDDASLSEIWDELRDRGRDALPNLNG